MNLLLLRPEEVEPDGRVVLRDRRARHLQDVLRVAPGREVRCGLLGGPTGIATVIGTAGDPAEVTVRCALHADGPPAGEDILLLAVPRPKVLRRVVEHATALGFGRIVLLRTWRVDRSHLESRAVEVEALLPHVLAGLEQSRRTRPPQIDVEPLFKPFVEDRLDEFVGRAVRFVADPEATTPTVDVRPQGPFALAIGPERGFTDYEVGKLEAAGFAAVRAGPHPLRVETAVAVLTGQLQLARQLALRHESSSSRR